MRRREVRSTSENGRFLIRAQPRRTDAETLIHKEMKTRGERERRRTEGKGWRRCSQRGTICSNTPSGAVATLSSLTVHPWMC